jgi:LCP family protein required for cell wall assembly
MLLAGAALAAIEFLGHRYDHAIARGQLLDPTARRERTDLDGALDYLLVGSDRRPGASGPDQRSDTILLVHVPVDARQAYLISIPRDLLVTVPPAPNGYPGGRDKINSAYEHGGGGDAGVRLLSATLARLTGLRFDGAALVDFAGLRQVVDLLGGVRMCVDTPVRSIHTGHLFAAGCQQMDGARALDYVRQRYDLPGGDYDRQRHQQQLLRAMLDRAGETNLHRDPVRLDRLIRAVGSSLTVDTNGVPLEDLLLALRDLPPNGLTGVQVPSHPETIDAVSYVVLDDGGDQLFAAVRGSRMPSWVRANARWVTQL